MINFSEVILELWGGRKINYFKLIGPSYVARSIKFLDQGPNMFPLQWKCRFLTTGPPGKSLDLCNFLYYIDSFYCVYI